MTSNIVHTNVYQRDIAQWNESSRGNKENIPPNDLHFANDRRFIGKDISNLCRLGGNKNQVPLCLIVSRMISSSKGLSQWRSITKDVIANGIMI